MTDRLLWDEIAAIADLDPERVALITDERGDHLRRAGRARGRACSAPAGGGAPRGRPRRRWLPPTAPASSSGRSRCGARGACWRRSIPESGSDELDYVLRNAQPKCIIADVARTQPVTRAVLSSGCPIAVHTMDDDGEVVSLPDRGRVVPALDRPGCGGAHLLHVGHDRGAQAGRALAPRLDRRPRGPTPRRGG